MPEEITINQELKIIEVMSYGDVTREESMASVKTLEELISKTGIKRVLSDTREQQSVPSATDIYNFASSLPRDMKCAVVLSDYQTTAVDVEFADTVAHNRGILIKKFSSREDALEWLDV